MRTQRAHYGCGSAFGVAVYSGLPTLEMLVVKRMTGVRDGEMESKQTGGETVKDGLG